MMFSLQSCRIAARRIRTARQLSSVNVYNAGKNIGASAGLQRLPMARVLPARQRRRPVTENAGGEFSLASSSLIVPIARA